ncbi:MAG TPA: HAMP domain-containing sensor histidine kinase [Candidatus Sulfopaludibacter sp.]|nr:HAMP domain-containing sensor histidine kinase [Candidatus Sulfopaludibacter sp.]
MKSYGQTRIEWALLALIAVVCAVLSFLQYRWTGELSRAEPALLRAGLNDQVRRLVQNFNDEIRESCTALLPDEREILHLGRLEAHQARYQQWLTSHDRSLFAQLAIAVPEQGTLNLYALDSGGKPAPMPWPESWEGLRMGMTARINGAGHPPNAPRNSNLIEIPVFSESGGEEVEWMIFNLNEDYLRQKVLPRMLSEYLNAGPEADYDASISLAAPPFSVVYSTRADGESVARDADAMAGIFSADMGVAPPPPGRGRGRGRGDEGRMPRWTIAVRHRAGSLDLTVARNRTRNLLASLILVALLGGTAWALVRYTARSRRLAEMQFRFAAGVSHDLRTPLTAIRGAAFNLVEGVVSEPAAIRRYLKLILRNAEELTSMIENVLAFSASIHAKKPEALEKSSVGDLLHQAAAAMSLEIEQAGCHLEVTVAPHLPAVDGDPAALELVFRNLIGNALRHGGGGNWIGVSAAPAADGVEIRVCDHGPGVAEAERESIFEPFYRGQQTRAQRVVGTGLGLSLVKNTVERYHGTIQVNNSPGGGAQFTVRLPAHAEPV